MYNEHFGLQELPFEITPNQQFYCNLPHHDVALNTVLASLQNGEGMIKITGEVGTGKTILCQKLLSQLDPQHFKSIHLPNPFYTPNQLRLTIAEELGIRAADEMTPLYLDKRLWQQMEILFNQENKRVVLVLDEAQLMPDETLETVRILTNLKKGSDRNLQIVMFGQPELDKRLKQPNLRQLLQRISFSYQLSTLNPKEQTDYISQRLIIAGYRHHGMFSKSALWLLKRVSGGIPRIINVLAHKAMLAAYARGKRKVTLRPMIDAIIDSKDVIYPQKSHFWRNAIWSALILGAAAFGYWYWFY